MSSLSSDNLSSDNLSSDTLPCGNLLKDIFQSADKQIFGIGLELFRHISCLIFSHTLNPESKEREEAEFYKGLDLVIPDFLLSGLGWAMAWADGDVKRCWCTMGLCYMDTWARSMNPTRLNGLEWRELHAFRRSLISEMEEMMDKIRGDDIITDRNQPIPRKNEFCMTLLEINCMMNPDETTMLDIFLIFCEQVGYLDANSVKVCKKLNEKKPADVARVFRDAMNKALNQPVPVPHKTRSG